MSLCTAFRQILIYFISMAPLRALYYLTKPLLLQFKIISLCAFVLLCYTNTIYLLLSCKQELPSFISYIFVVARLLYPLFFIAGLAWSSQLIQISSYYFMYYVLGLFYGLVVIGSIPCQGLISDQHTRREYKNKTKLFLRSLLCGARICGTKVSIQRASEPPHPSRTINLNAVLEQGSKSISERGPHLVGAQQLTYQDQTLVESCAICLEKYLAREKIACLNRCEHFFHKQCLKQWCKTGSDSCPLCRTKYPLPLIFTPKL